LLTKGRTYRLNIYTKLIGTLLAIAISLTCLFSIYSEYSNEPGLNRASLITYQSLSHTGWSLTIAWLIFLCSTNQGGIVNQILSWPIWSPFARLNYSAFLVHPTILYIFIFNRTIPFYYQAHLLLANFVSHIFFSYAAAVLVNIFFETPFVVIEKKLFKPRRKNHVSQLKN
jgi:peptidoglycan/LPS O-acetylase OafA/YrhL